MYSCILLVKLVVLATLTILPLSVVTGVGITATPVVMAKLDFLWLNKVHFYVKHNDYILCMQLRFPCKRWHNHCCGHWNEHH